jgi:hypothetical protein
VVRGDARAAPAAAVGPHPPAGADGRHLELFALDTRQYRVPRRTLLGETSSGG